MNSLSATVFVDGRGLVHELSGMLYITNSPPITVDLSHRFSEAGSPPTPKWTRRVPQVTVTRESGTIAIENAGSAVISAGARSIVFIANDSVSIADQIEFSEPLEPDDIVYLSLAGIGNQTGNGLIDGEIRISERPPPTNESIRSPFEWQWISFECVDGDRSVRIVRKSWNSDEN